MCHTYIDLIVALGVPIYHKELKFHSEANSWAVINCDDKKNGCTDNTQRKGTKASLDLCTWQQIYYRLTMFHHTEQIKSIISDHH